MNYNQLECIHWKNGWWMDKVPIMYDDVDG